ncbi:protein-tyrosine phosphatase-like protein [Aspergillus pseudonomiae]|uniref:Protein-tyrosine phosphatase-like protein n=1 Tax=Aspergillus pseudonomiae TaxID=1506151 RepID=A0A5N6I1N8_9EURO|nr:protein-tyrosine phosphatase-like protein [Aspergillus pseudonomiae]KAB8260632.1 protein-tyrosine phosphatase-like protein [Aspergillus pseudonomiae]KAE8403082.1 protein-tyrosine phosphatase-like protein [Aspergillus pseudonomiae]
MERTRVAKVDDVTLARRGEQVVGTLHLTPHHIIFSHIPSLPDSAQPSATPIRPRELWITYPIISFCTFRPAPAASRQPSSIRLRCRDFAFVCFYFASETRGRDVYESIRQWTCKVGRIEKLYAFTYQPPPPERELNSWELYDPLKEWARQGVDRDNHGWRISRINSDYTFSPTYPALLPVPSSISDNTLNYAGRYRSRARVPVLTYLHPVNNCSITRSSQPLVGVRQNRSIQDEKLLAAIFSTSRSERPLANFNPAHLDRESSSSTQGDANDETVTDFTRTEDLEDELLTSFYGDSDGKHQVYGAQQHNLIVDARPTVNAFAMQAVGLGSENMDNYKFATKAYLGIDNIHVMRDSLNKVIDALKDSDVTPLGPNRDQLARSGWLKHITGILDGAGLIARQVGLQHSHVLIHCSDGWDRTGQLSALSQICLDPYYRTMEGFMVLVEKDWLSFGHMFRHRSGHLNSEKWFQIENERIGGDSSRGFGEAGGAGKAIENAFLSAKGFFNRDNTSRDSLPESDGEMQSYDSDTPGPKKLSSAPRSVTPEKEMTKVKETSPVFHQFLDATYQLLYQYPTRFEFNERFLRRLLYHLYSCQYGTFLYNSEKERVESKAKERTRSVWDYFLARREQFLNAKYDPHIDDHKRGKERLIFPRLSEVRWWAEAFGRTDAEMNGFRSTGSPPARRENIDAERSPVLTGIEIAQDPVTSSTGMKGAHNAASAGMAAVTSGISSLAFSKPKENGQDPKSMGQLEVEMQ